jgi:hypothetical protein
VGVEAADEIADDVGQRSPVAIDRLAFGLALEISVSRKSASTRQEKTIRPNMAS